MAKTALLTIPFTYEDKKYRLELKKFSYELWVYDYHKILEGALGLFAADIKQKSWKPCGINPPLLQAALHALWALPLKSASYRVRYNAIRLIIFAAYGDIAAIHLEKLNEKAGMK